MISSTRSSCIALIAAATGIGVADVAARLDARGLELRDRAAASARSAPGGSAGTTTVNSAGDGGGALAHGREERARRRRSGFRSRARARARAARSRSTTTCSTGTSPAALRARSIRFPRSQPERSSGCVEMIISSGSYSREPVAERLQRIGIDDGARGRRCRPRAGGRASAAADARRPSAARPRRRRSRRAARSAGEMTVTRIGPSAARAPHARRGASARRRSRSRARGPGGRTPRRARHGTVSSIGAGFSALLGLVAVPVHDRVPRAADAVLVRAADDLRDLVEVEDRRRRGHLPLERERAPRVRRRDRRRSASSTIML